MFYSSQKFFQLNLYFSAYRRIKNLKEILAPSEFRPSSATNQKIEEGGCSKCDKKRCDLCKNFGFKLLNSNSSATGKLYPIRQKLICSSKNVIYLATCRKCNLQYVGSTSTEFRLRASTTNKVTNMWNGGNSHYGIMALDLSNEF